ncbi:hypothetical protein F3G61_31695, partial [Pseudomonas aeruginosa]
SISRSRAGNRRRCILASLAGCVTPGDIELGSKEEKTLGLRWFYESDEMGFRTHPRDPKDIEARTPTKREVTSSVMSILDPMGLASPVLIEGKALIQIIWRSGIDWDDVILEKDEVAWKHYMENLRMMQDLRIARYFSYCNTEGRCTRSPMLARRPTRVQ